MLRKYKRETLQQKLYKNLGKEYEICLYPIKLCRKDLFIPLKYYKKDLPNNENEVTLTTLLNAYLLNPEVLSFYDWQDKDSGDYYLLLAIPNSIYLNYKKYFIGEVGYKNVVASVLCKNFIPKEFIFGIGRKSFDPNRKDYIYFDRNKYHISYKSKRGQAIKNILQNRQITLEMLEAINNDDINYEGTIENKKIVLETIKQKQLYLDNNKALKYSEENILEKIKRDLKGPYYIGLHNVIGCRCFYFVKDKHLYLNSREYSYLDDNLYKVAYECMKEEGLNVPYENTRFTITNLGSVDDLTQESFFSYNYWGMSNYCNIIVAVPKCFSIDGKEYFVGTLYKGIASSCDTLLNSVLLKEKVPSEFIYGRYIKHEKEKETYIFQTNENHIHKKTKEEQEVFYKNLLTACNIDKNTLEIIGEEQEMTSDVLRNTIEEKRRVFKTEDKPKIKQKNLCSLDS